MGAGAPIDCFAVGTKVGTSTDAPCADCAYKLVAYDGRPVLKLSPGKQTLAGPKQVFRVRGSTGAYTHDRIATADEPPPPGVEPLLAEVVTVGTPSRYEHAIVIRRRPPACASRPG